MICCHCWYTKGTTYYAVLWPVLNGISITRSPVEIPFRALLFVGISSGHNFFCSMTQYDITIGNDVARDVHYEFIMGHSIVVGTYHDVTNLQCILMLL